jgi:hypothetical protein
MDPYGVYLILVALIGAFLGWYKTPLAGFAFVGVCIGKEAVAPTDTSQILLMVGRLVISILTALQMLYGDVITRHCPCRRKVAVTPLVCIHGESAAASEAEAEGVIGHTVGHPVPCDAEPPHLYVVQYTATTSHGDYRYMGLSRSPSSYALDELEEAVTVMRPPLDFHTVRLSYTNGTRRIAHEDVTEAFRQVLGPKENFHVDLLDDDAASPYILNALLFILLPDTVCPDLCAGLYLDTIHDAELEFVFEGEEVTRRYKCTGDSFSLDDLDRLIHGASLIDRT